MSSVTLEKREGVKPLEIPFDSSNLSKKKWKGKNIFPGREYWCSAILSKRRSGKSTLVYNLIKSFSDKNTIVILYSSSINKDKIYDSLFKYLQEEQIPYQKNTHFIDDETGANYLSTFMATTLGKGKEKGEEEKPSLCEVDIDRQRLNAGETLQDIIDNPSFCSKEESEEKEESKEKYIIVFDDLGSDLRDPSVTKLLKVSFHLRAKIILSSQSITDLAPQAHHQLDYVFIGPNFNEASVKQTWERIQPPEEFSVFLAIYKEVTKTPYSFLLIDRLMNEYRKNLNFNVAT